MAPPAWAYNPDNFRPVLDPEFLCSICKNIFCDPLVTPCNYLFCRKCIIGWLPKSNSCPICRSCTLEFALRPVYPMVKNIISHLRLKCKNSSRGCTEILTIDSCEDHEKICSFESIRCPNTPCKDVCSRIDLLEHETKTCLHSKIVDCDGCQLKIPSKLSGNHNCIEGLKKIIENKDKEINLLKKYKKAYEEKIDDMAEKWLKERVDEDKMKNRLKEYIKTCEEAIEYFKEKWLKERTEPAKQRICIEDEIKKTVEIAMAEMKIRPTEEI